MEECWGRKNGGEGRMLRKVLGEGDWLGSENIREGGVVGRKDDGQG